MDFSNLTVFKMAGTKMSYDSERGALLAHNISNADTPGFQPLDLKPLNFRNMAMAESARLEMRATSPSHIVDTGRVRNNFRNEKMNPTFETTPVGNAVVLEEQMMKVAGNSLDYQLTTSLYRKTADMFKVATGNR